MVRPFRLKAAGAAGGSAGRSKGIGDAGAHRQQAVVAQHHGGLVGDRAVHVFRRFHFHQLHAAAPSQHREGDDGRCAMGDCVGDKVLAVEAAALEGAEDIAAHDLAMVDGKTGDFGIGMDVLIFEKSMRSR